ncbi:hypothetical protein EDD17DRAFT_1766790 [Pisolithus thermaeus]|nr:hypothetical protein EV401DRAFT_2080125 [Pisolithus croceorrhizus]KAI6148261.1 hypothetical protein EDD17DRAFT_1766790 [Pisolithus thermaeus]
MDISQKVKYLLNTMQLLQITLPQFILGLLSSKKYEKDPVVLDFTSQINNIIEIVNKYSETGKKNIQVTANNIMMKTYVSKIARLAAEGSGLHFDAACVNVQQLEEFDIDDLVWKMKGDAPYLWETIGEVLSSHKEQRMGSVDMNIQSVNDEDEYYDTLEGCNINLGEPTSKSIRQHAKKVIILSILVQNTNQKKVVETLTQMGLSISVTSISSAILSLSKESNCTIKSLGCTMLMAYAYDNFDVDLKTSDQRVEKSNNTLKHLTSGLLFPLQHGTSLDDLHCLHFLWEQSVHNIHVPAPAEGRMGRTYRDLLELHPESRGGAGTSCRLQYNAWKILSDLVEHGPAYFQGFKDMVGEPEFVEAIPVVKTLIIAACTMESINSTVSGNIQSITSLLAQAGIHDPKDMDNPNMPDISDYVVLFHGDLGTAEHVHAILQCQAVEDSPWNQCQYVIFIPGLFHLKMAAADALWHAFIHPTAARHDDMSLMHDVGILRPKETGIYQSKPGFRHMHQLITYSGICRRLDCWRSEVVNLDPKLKSLEAFADMRPTFAQLKRDCNYDHRQVCCNECTQEGAPEA